MKSAHETGIFRALYACIASLLLAWSLGGCGGGGGSPGTGTAQIDVVSPPPPAMTSLDSENLGHGR
jgi:hypothetical protein